MADYTDNEMMALAAGRFIKNGDIVFAGTGVSMLAATAAKRIYAPKGGHISLRQEESIHPLTRYPWPLPICGS